MPQKTLFDTGPEPPKFDGETFDPEKDQQRLERAIDRVYSLMSDGHWRTLAEIAYMCGCSEPGASARIRDLRKPGFKTSHPCDDVESKRMSDGLWLYRVIGARPCPRTK